MSNFKQVILGGDGEPPEPDWSETYIDPAEIEVASREWGVVIRELKAAYVLAVANGHAVRRLVDFRLMYARAAKHVAEHGMVFRAKGLAQVGAVNPNYGLMSNCQKHIMAIEAELGISPTKRSRATKAQKKMPTSKPSDAYLFKSAG